MVTCSKCGTGNPEGSRFCNRCGSALGPSSQTGASGGRIGPESGDKPKGKSHSNKRMIVCTVAVVAIILVSTFLVIGYNYREQDEPVKISPRSWTRVYELYPNISEFGQTLYYCSAEMSVSQDGATLNLPDTYKPISFDEYSDVELMRLRELATHVSRSYPHSSDYGLSEEDNRIVRDMLATYPFLKGYKSDDIVVHFTNGTSTITAYHFILKENGDNKISLCVGTDGMVYTIKQYYSKTWDIGLFHLPGWHQVEDFYIYKY